MLLIEVPFFDLFDGDKLANLASTAPKKPAPCRSGSWSSGNIGCPRNGGFNRHSFRQRPHSWFTAPATKPTCAKKQEGPQSPAAKPETKSPTTTIVKSDLYTVAFDLKPFQPAEISVKMDGNTLVVSGRRETQSDGEYELREYHNKVVVPENVLIDQMKCALDESGQLQIEAPLKKTEEAEKPSERIIPIQFVKNAQDQDMALD